MKRASLFLVIVFVAVLSGCSSKYMQPADPGAAETQPGPGEAKIVFFRATSLGGGIQSWVCEEREGKLAYIAVVSAGAKIAHMTTPGKHMYMTGAENAELLEATLEEGKTYYAYIAPRVGWWKARFVFEPVRNDMLQTATLKKDLAWCEWRESNADAQVWFRDNLPSLNDKYIEALADFMKKPAERKILRPEDGSAVPVR